MSTRLGILTPRRYRPWVLPMVSSQRRPMRSMDTTTKVSPGANQESSECQPRRLLVPEYADILIDVRKDHTGGQQLLALGFRVAARQLGDSGAAGTDIAVGVGHRVPSNW